MSINSDYYNKNADTFIKDTFACDMSVQYDFFEKELHNAKVLLDLGFGSGRDSLYFIKKGYEVYSLDPGEEFCKRGKDLGLPHVICKYAQDIDDINKYDGIWACASLLHVPSKELNKVFKRCALSLKEKGIMYASFKYGDYEGERNGRVFTDLNEDLLKEYLSGSSLTISRVLITEDVRPERTTKWLNVILIKE